MQKIIYSMNRIFVMSLIVCSLSMLGCIQHQVKHESVPRHMWSVHHYQDGSGELLPRGKESSRSDVVYVTDVYVSSFHSPLELGARSLGYSKKDGRMLYGRLDMLGDK